MAKERTPRIEREQDTRTKSWQPPTTLPDPAPSDGWVFRWIRISTLGASDPQNYSVRTREGWVPVKAEDHPEIALDVVKTLNDPNTRLSGTIEIGGLVLCKAPFETMKQRNDYYRDMATKQMEGVDSNYLRQNDARMPLLKPERNTRTSFGSD